MKKPTLLHHSTDLPLRRAGLLALAFVAMLATSSFGNTWVWTGGGGANGNWNNSANWGSAGIPANGDTVVFQGATGLNTTNNIASLTLSQIKFIATGFAINGNAFTITNSIVASNFVGSATINSAFTVATADVTVLTSNSITLTLNGSVGGAVGVTKTGLGTLLYQTSGNNAYSGTTRVYAGTLQLNISSVSAVGPALVIGDGSGSGSPIVRLLQSSEISDTTTVTVNINGLLDLNNFYEEIGNLTIQGGTAASGTSGTLVVNGNLTTLAATVQASITGNLQFVGGMPIISVADGGAFYDLNCVANITDNGNGLFFTNSPAGTSCFVVLGGSNTITGPVIMNNLTVSPITSYSLGATNPVTVGGNGTLWLYSSGFTNKTLTLQAGATVTSQNNNTWAGPIVLGGNVFINGSYPAGATLNLAGGISGTGNIAVNNGDPGWSLLLSGSVANTFNGDLSIQTGTLQLSKGLFDGTIPHNLFIGDATHSATNRFLVSNQIGNNSTVTLYSGSLLDLNNFIDGIGSLVMYGGSVTMGTGLLDMYSPGTIITPSPTSGSLNISGVLGLQVPCTFMITNGLTITAQIYGSGSLTKTSFGSLFLQGANTYTGLTSVQAGYVWAQNNSALGTTNAGTVVSSGATLVLQGNIGITNESLTLNGLGNPGYMALDCEYAETNTWTGPITLNADSNIGNYSSAGLLHLSGPISGAGGLIEGGQSGYTGTLSLEGNSANTYVGQTTVNSGTTLLLNKTVSNVTVPGNLDIFGTLRLGTSRQIANVSDVTIEGGGLFDCGIFFDDIDALSGSGSMTFGAGGWIELGLNNGSSTFNGVISGTGYTLGGYSVAKRGSGTIALNGNNTFANGAYHVFSPGTLLVNGSSPQAPVIVDFGATVGGNGVVSTIAAAGTIAPGSSLGILTSSNVTFASSGNLTVSLAGPTVGSGYDQLNVIGTNALASAALSVVPAFTTPVTIGQQFTILNNDLADPIVGTFNGLAEGATISTGGYKFTISYVGGTGNDVVLTLTAIPGAVAGSTVTSGDGSHGLDPNGCNNFALVITNTSGLAMTGVNATLSTTTPGVLITQPYSPYPSIPASGNATNLAPFQISTLPSFVCGSTINLQLSVSSSLGAFTVNLTQSTGEPAAPTRFDNNIVTNCPDVGSIDSTNTVAGWSGGPITKVAVSLWLVAPFSADMSLSLIAPDGTTVPLVSGIGAGANFGSGSADGSRTTFDDSAATAITAGASPFVGTFRPQGALASFNGIGTINGAWHLHIVDGFGSGSPDTLRNWSLFLYGTGCATGSGACDYCLTSASGIITNTDLLLTNRISRNLVEASCGALKTFPGIASGNYHYDLYSFTNTSASDACVTVLLTGSGDVQAGVYLNAFIPTNISSNYVADSGSSTASGPQSCSASIPPGATFFVTVNEVALGTGSAYTLQLSGLPCPPPTLNIQPVTTNQARLYWPSWAGGYLLEATPSLAPTSWTTITNEPIVSALKYNVTNSTVAPTNRFYRLRLP